MMGLIDDDEIEDAPQQMLGVFLSSGRRNRRDDTLLPPERMRIGAQQRVMRGRESQAEFGLQFFPPLPDQRGWRQHQHTLRHAAQRIFLEHHARLDGLAEADLVGEQDTAAELLQNLPHGLDLMPQWFDASQMRKAEQFVEALSEAKMGQTLA